MVTPVRTQGRSSPVTGVDADVCLLADDHALLLRGVQRRASPVLAPAAARTWPYAELDTLTGFHRTAVLPHATHEEDRLYPDRVSAPFAQPSARHAHLCALTELLEDADATSCTLSELQRLVDGLEHHMIEEQAVLAAPLATLEDAPCVAEPRHRRTGVPTEPTSADPHRWAAGGPNHADAHPAGSKSKLVSSHPLAGSTICKPTASNARNVKCQRTQRSTESW